MAKRFVLVMAVMTASSLFAQVHSSGRRDFGAGWGNVLFPGGVRPLNFGNNYDFAHRLGGTVAGVPYTGAPSGGFGGGGLRGNRLVYVPLPVYVGGYYGYTPTVEAPPNVTVVLQSPAGQAPVVINQNFVPDAARPVMQEYPPSPNQDDPNSSPSPSPSPSSSGLRTYQAPMPVPTPDPQAESSPASRAIRGGAPPAQSSADVAEQKATIYLIAFKDQTIQASYAYWVEGNTLHYVTVQGSHNRATLDLIDRKMSDRLNRERNVDFNLARAR